MDGAAFSPYPQHSWFRFQPAANPQAKPSTDSVRMVNHVICLVTAGQARLTTERRRHSKITDLSPGTVHYRPADDDEYLIHGRPLTGDHMWFGLMIPDGHLSSLAEVEGIALPREFRELVLANDAQSQFLLSRLGTSTDRGVSQEEWARLLLIRLIELSGGGGVDWVDDTSVFVPRVMQNLVDCIDAQLRDPPQLADLAAAMGMSPTHFARKFRRSTGLSLYRFVNRRRLRASLDQLTNRSIPLAQLSLDLGFSSQSHFTRLFSALTGMPPARYRRQFQRTSG